jgi:DNA-binding transcriptional ArsR family regulator
LSSQHDTHLDCIFHALSDTTRRALLKRLSKGPAIISELVLPFSMSFPAVSKHLKVLEEARLVRRIANGRTYICAIDDKGMAEAETWMSAYRAFWKQSLDAFADHVEKGEGRQSKPMRKLRAKS